MSENAIIKKGKSKVPDEFSDAAGVSYVSRSPHHSSMQRIVHYLDACPDLTTMMMMVWQRTLIIL